MVCSNPLAKYNLTCNLHHLFCILIVITRPRQVSFIWTITLLEFSMAVLQHPRWTADQHRPPSCCTTILKFREAAELWVNYSTGKPFLLTKISQTGKLLIICGSRLSDDKHEQSAVASHSIFPWLSKKKIYNIRHPRNYTPFFLTPCPKSRPHLSSWTILLRVQFLGSHIPHILPAISGHGTSLDYFEFSA